MSKRQLIFGLVLVLIGMIFLLQTLDILWISFSDLIELLIPIGLIGVGVWLIIRKRQQERKIPPAGPTAQPTYQSSGWEQSGTAFDSGRVSPPPPPSPHPPHSGEEEPKEQPRADHSQSTYTGQKVKYSNMFGDLNITCENIDMRNVEVSGFLGDIEVLLRQAKLGPGLSRMVISGFIGDIRIMVPVGMAVFASASGFIGDLDLFGRKSSGFGNSLDGQTASYNSAEAKLYIAINTFIGDVRVVEV